MKQRLILSTLLMLGVTGVATASDTFTTKGHVLYKAGDKLEKKAVSLHLPKAGKGNITLEVDGKKVDSFKHQTVKVAGRTIFNVFFRNAPYTSKGTITMLSGTYLRGENMATYYGDFYLKAPKPSNGGSCPVGGCCPSNGCDCEDCECEDCDQAGCDVGGCGCGETCPCDDSGDCGTAKATARKGKGARSKFAHWMQGWEHRGGFGFFSNVAK